MPEPRLARTRATLPEGYKFGDANPERQAFGVFMEQLLDVVYSAQPFNSAGPTPQQAFAEFRRQTEHYGE